jgi:hypothetical protein
MHPNKMRPCATRPANETRHAREPCFTPNAVRVTLLNCGEARKLSIGGVATAGVEPHRFSVGKPPAGLDESGTELD